MKVTKQARRDAKQWFRMASIDGLLDHERARQVVQHLITKKPRGFARVLTHFQRLIQLDAERRAAKIESAVALTPEYQQAVKQNLVKTYGNGLTFTFTQNPALIGGLRIRVGSDVYDGTVQGRLTRLQESF